MVSFESLGEDPMTLDFIECISPASDAVHEIPLARTRTGARARALAESEFTFIWRLLRRMGLSKEDADDAAQEVFLVALRRLPNIALGSERPFLIGTAYRVVGTHRRSFARREVATASFVPPSERNHSPEDLTQRRRDLEALDTALECMPDELRVVFALFELEEVPEPEIARALEIPRGTVASRLRRARKFFHDHIQRCRKGGNS